MTLSGIRGMPSLPPSNRLLAALRPELRERLAPHLELVHFNPRDVLAPADEPVPYVLFIESGFCSLVASTREGQAVECAAVGLEGFVGTPAIVAGQGLPVDTVAQTSGTALRMTAEAFRRELEKDEEFREISRRYVHALLAQALQSAACNRLHSLEERCARWLLTAHDRVGQQSLSVTQEALAATLGVRRPSLTLVASVLQRAGLITYRRGEMKILDRRGLETTACECYGVIREYIDRVTPR